MMYSVLLAWLMLYFGVPWEWENILLVIYWYAQSLEHLQIYKIGRNILIFNIEWKLNLQIPSIIWKNS